MKTINEDYMDAAFSKASKGLVAVWRTLIQPGMPVYRFGDSIRPDAQLTGGWWVGYSPFESLKQYAQRRKQTLSAAARQCLAVDFQWSTLDVLHTVILKTPLSAWAGTPRTQRIRRANSDRRWEPDREITQLYIPGLDQPDPNSPRLKIWETAFQIPVRICLQA